MPSSAEIVHLRRIIQRETCVFVPIRKGVREVSTDQNGRRRALSEKTPHSLLVSGAYDSWYADEWKLRSSAGHRMGGDPSCDLVKGRKARGVVLLVYRNAPPSRCLHLWNELIEEEESI